MTDITEIWKFPLRRGNSSHPRYGACFMDAVSYLEYGTLGDHPECVCPVIAAFGRVINDAMSEEGRQRLRVFIPRLVGTVDPESERARSEYLAWQAIRVFAPLALETAGFRKQATALRNFEGSLQDAAAVADAAKVDARALGVASGVAAWAEAAARTAATWDFGGYTASCAAANTVAIAANTAAANSIEDAIIVALDGVLAIGRQAEPMDMQQAWLAVRNFELASS